MYFFFGVHTGAEVNAEMDVEEAVMHEWSS